MVLKYEDYFDIKCVDGDCEALDLESFKQEFFNKVYSNKYSTNKSVSIIDNAAYSIVLKDEVAFSLTNQKTMKALINFLLQVGEVDVARTYIDNTKNNFDQSFVNTVSSRIYYEQGSFDLALECLPKKLDNYDKCELAGNVYEKMGMIEEAIKSLEKALHYKVVCEAYHKIGKLYLSIDKKTKAIQNLLMAHNVNFKNKDVIKDIAAYYYNESDYNEAIKFLNMVRKETEVMKFFAAALFLTGEKSKAKRIFKNFNVLVDDVEVESLLEGYTKLEDSIFFDVAPSIEKMKLA